LKPRFGGVFFYSHALRATFLPVAKDATGEE
jgi:hypothetical protein